jgi:hypothetical protein
MSVSGFTWTNASRHGNIRLRVAIIQRGIVSASWLDPALLEERQLLAQKQIFRGERTAGMRCKNSQSD